MARVTDNPKKFIISCRVNQREMYLLQEMAQEQAMSITALVRQSLNLPEEAPKRAVR